LLLAQLTADEKSRSVVYVAAQLIAGGTQLSFPRTRIDVPWDALLAFIDREPTANWSHACRYLLLNRETGEARSIDAQLPPFRPDQIGYWRVAYKAPSVPDAVVMTLR
ncbi:MAG: hypothetical protein KGJ80_03125, partial [Chloroflexota bacterium]|nr:hypothetical protein [Chloroflexota bacterium]